MGILKSCLALVLILTLHACSSKVTQAPEPEQTAAVATPAVAKEEAVAQTLQARY